MNKTILSKVLDWALEGLTILSGTIMVVSGVSNIYKNRTHFKSDMSGFMSMFKQK